MTPPTRRALSTFSPLFRLSPLCALFLNACSFTPQEVVRFRADRAGSTWSNGMELHSSRAGRLEIRTGFLGYSQGGLQGYGGPHPLSFLISATNPSDSAVLVDPLDFRIAVPGQGRDSSLAAIDPEAVIHQARQDMAAEAAEHAGSEGSDLAFVAVGAVLDLGLAFSTRTPEEGSDSEERWERHRENRESSRMRHRERMAELSARERLWSDSALRKTTLPPGGTLRGRIGFAVGSYAAIPDTVRLEYREGTAGFSDLVTYGRVREKPAAPAEAKAAGAEPAATHFRSSNR